MRGREKKMQRLNRGQTIAAEREKAESDSERLLEHKKQNRKRKRSVVFAVAIVVTLGVLLYITGQNLVRKYRPDVLPVEDEYVIRANIIDEDNRGRISTRTKEYIAQLEQDFADLGYTVAQVVLPTGTSRELYVDIAGEEVYFKVNTDRGTAVTAEDASRMLKYLKENDLHPTYVDVRLDGKAYYK